MEMKPAKRRKPSRVRTFAQVMAPEWEREAEEYNSPEAKAKRERAASIVLNAIKPRQKKSEQIKGAD